MRTNTNQRQYIIHLPGHITIHDGDTFTAHRGKDGNGDICAVLGRASDNMALIVDGKITHSGNINTNNTIEYLPLMADKYQRQAEAEHGRLVNPAFPAHKKYGTHWQCVCATDNIHPYSKCKCDMCGMWAEEY
jgi:hypothetical protein